MKVYTEVNYIWKDNKLVQTDSKSYEYEGEVTQCHERKLVVNGQVIITYLIVMELLAMLM